MLERAPGQSRREQGSSEEGDDESHMVMHQK